MLAFFRSLTRSKWVLAILFAPLLVSLSLFGNVRDAFRNIAVRDAVVTAGSRTVRSAEFASEMEGQKRAYEQQQGHGVTYEELAQHGVIDEVLANLAQRESLMSILAKAGIRPSDNLVADKLRQIPGFFNPVTHQFDEKLFEQRLAEAHVTQQQLHRGFSDEIAQDHFSSALANGLRAPMVYPALVAAFQMEQRSFTAFPLSPSSVGAPPKPTDDELNAFIKAHATAMTLPETRSLTLVKMSSKTLEPTITVDPAEVKKTYEFRKDTLSIPEKRSITQVPAKDAAQAQVIEARLEKGEAPAAVAKSLGVEPVVYTDSPRTAIADKAVGDAAFSLSAGQVSKPIQGSLGWAVVKVDAVTPGKTVTFEDARRNIEDELRALQAQKRIYALAEAFSKAHEGGATLKEAAKAAGVTPLDLPPVTAQGTDLKGTPQPLLDDKILTAAFAQPEGGETDITEDGKGEYFAVRVDKVIAPHLRSLADDRAEITQAYVGQKMRERIAKKLDELAARVKKGESMDNVAASIGSKTFHGEVNFIQAQQAARSAQGQVLAAIFNAKVGEVIPVGAVLARLDGIKPGPLDATAHFAATGVQEMTQGLRTGFLGPQAMAWATRTAKAKTNPTLARQAIGLGPAGQSDGGDGAGK